MLKSLKARLTALYVCIFSAFLVVLCAYFHLMSSVRVWSEFDKDLRRDAEAFASLYLEEIDEQDRGVVENWRGELTHFTGLLSVEAAVHDPSGANAFSTPGLKGRNVDPPVFPGNGKAVYKTYDWEFGKRQGSFRMAHMEVRVPGHGMVRLDFGRSAFSIQRFLQRQLIGMVVTVPLLTALAALAGFLFVRKALRPVQEMSQLAQEISAGDLQRRVPLPDSEGELKKLALTLNGMLGRLEESFGRLKTFTGDAAHELKTPLATMRAALESSMGKSHQELEVAVGDSLEILGQMNEIVEKLLFLARADAGPLIKGAREVNITRICAQIASALQPMAAIRGMTLDVLDRDWISEGDEALLRRAIHNLVENAIKYGKQGGKIQLAANEMGIGVIDDGPGIPADHIPHLFKPFYRVDPSRSERVPGSGLGLAIVKSICTAHGGRVEVDSRPGRTEFRIVLGMKGDVPAGARP